MQFKLEHFDRCFTNNLCEEQLSGAVTLISLAKYLIYVNFYLFIGCNCSVSWYFSDLQKSMLPAQLVYNVHIYIFEYLCVTFLYLNFILNIFQLHMHSNW